MKHLYSALLLGSLLILGATGCSKDDDGGGSSGTSCNNVTMKLKKYQSISSPSDSMVVYWNTDGTLGKFVTRMTGYQDYNTTFVYSGGKIVRGIIRLNGSNTIVDTAEYHYNSDNLVDSIYMRQTTNSFANQKITYSNGKIAKLSGYSRTTPTFYCDITTDANGNVTSSVEYWKNGATWKKETQYTFERDDRKNPLAPMTVYLLCNGMDYAYKFLRNWGPNNFTNQRAQDFTVGLDVISGFKYTYNSNCYPSAGQVTIGGVALFPGDDVQFIYN